MKKNKLLVILSLALTLSCLLSALSMNVFAGMLENYYYVTNEEFTAVTNTYGYSSAVFTGNYYGLGDSRNNAIVVFEARGSLNADFLTEIYVDFAGQMLDPYTSPSSGDQTVNVTFNPANVTKYDYINSLQCCTSNDNYADYWDRYYYAEWWGFPYGWGNYNQTPN